MKTVVIEKKIQLDHFFDQVDQLSCVQHLLKTAQSDGLECSGALVIKATGTINSHLIPIEESIDVSIFAPFHKLSDTNAFDVSLKNSDFLLNGNELFCTFHFDVEGILSDDEIYSDEHEQNEKGSIDDILDESDSVYETVRYVLTLENDTYASIAQRYQINEKTIRHLNQDKNFHGRTLILLPRS